MWVCFSLTIYMRCWGITWLARDHPSRHQQSQESDPGLSDPCLVLPPQKGWHHTPSQDFSSQSFMECLSLKSSLDQFFSTSSPSGCLRAQGLGATQFCLLQKKFQEGTFQVLSPLVDIKMIFMLLTYLIWSKEAFKCWRESEDTLSLLVWYIRKIVVWRGPDACMHARHGFPLLHFAGKELLLCLDSSGLGFPCVLQPQNWMGSSNAGWLIVERTKCFSEDSGERSRKRNGREEEQTKGKTILSGFGQIDQ